MLQGQLGARACPGPPEPAPSAPGGSWGPLCPPHPNPPDGHTARVAAKINKADGCGRIRMSVGAQCGHAATALLSKQLRPCALALPLHGACSHLAFEEDEGFGSCKTSQEKNLEHT